VSRVHGKVRGAGVFSVFAGALILRTLLGARGKALWILPPAVRSSLGDREAAFNHDLGQRAASSGDILVLVGPRRTGPIREGGLAAGMDASRIEVVGSIAAAHSFLQNIAAPGDTILFENDLPDNYDE